MSNNEVIVMKSAISDSMEFHVVNGLYFVTCKNIKLKENEEQVATSHQGIGSSWREAKYRFWSTWRSDNPTLFLTPSLNT